MDEKIICLGGQGKKANRQSWMIHRKDPDNAQVQNNSMNGQKKGRQGIVIELSS